MSVRRSRGGAPVFSPVKRAFLVIILIVLSLSIYFGMKVLKNSQATNIRKTIEIQDLKDEIANEESKAFSINKSKNQKTTDEDYEALARKELGLIKKDEIVIKPR